MRIYYDHQVFSLQRYGGITRLYEGVIAGVARSGLAEIDLVLGLTDSHAVIDLPSESRSHIRHYGSSIFHNRLANYALNEIIASGLAIYSGRYDIYHSTYFRYNPAVRAKYHVCWHHDCAPELYPDLFDNTQRIYRMRKKQFQASDRILCISESSRRDLLHFYDVPPERTVVVPSAATKMTRSATQESTLAAIIDGSYLLYVGARFAYKNFSQFLRAFAASGLAHEFRILAIGGGNLSDEHRNLANELSIGSRLTVVPYAEQELLAEAYARASLLVYPSLYEGFGLPPLEAALLGTVSLVADQPAACEIYGNAAFFFERASFDSFVASLRRSVSDQSLRKELLLRAQQRARSYNWSNCISRLLDEYKLLAEGAC